MTTIESEYARLKALADAATRGPWEHVHICRGEELVLGPGAKQKIVCDMYNTSNAAFIASAHDMMALIERLMQERKRAISALEAQRRFRHDLSICGCQGCIDTRALLGVAPVADAGPTPFAGRRTDRTRE